MTVLSRTIPTLAPSRMKGEGGERRKGARNLGDRNVTITKARRKDGSKDGRMKGRKGRRKNLRLVLLLLPPTAFLPSTAIVAPVIFVNEGQLTRIGWQEWQVSKGRLVMESKSASKVGEGQASNKENRMTGEDADPARNAL
jgi:hypothetical protein